MAFRPANITAHMIKFNSANSAELIDLYNSAVTDEITAHNSRPKHQTIAPSSFRCDRINWFRIRGVEPDAIKKVDVALDFTAQLGTACHEMIQRRLSEKLGTDWLSVEDHLKEVSLSRPEYVYNTEQSGYETKVELIKPYPVTFAVDGLIMWKGKKYLVEIKTSEFSTFNDLVEPKPRHIDQIKCYATILNLSNVLVIYMDRQYGDIKCFELNMTASDERYVWDKMQRIVDAVESNLAPDPLPKGDSNCTRSMCPYFDKCAEWGR